MWPAQETKEQGPMRKADRKKDNLWLMRCELMDINMVPGRRNEDLISIRVIFGSAGKVGVQKMGGSRSLQVLRTTGKQEIKSKTNTCKNAVFRT